MRKFFYKIKAIFSLTDRLLFLEREINEIEERIKKIMEEHSKVFEKKIQEMTFAYTRNLDGTKFDYLKRYLEIRVNCMQQELNSLPNKINNMQAKLYQLESNLDKKQDLER